MSFHGIVFRSNLLNYGVEHNMCNIVRYSKMKFNEKFHGSCENAVFPQFFLFQLGMFCFLISFMYMKNTVYISCFFLLCLHLLQVLEEELISKHMKTIVEVYIYAITLLCYL